MFTGIVQAVGRISATGERIAVDFDSGFATGGISTGESIAVNGACLTATNSGTESCAFFASPETLAKTNLGDLQDGDPVNLERALQIGDRLGGHFLQGHIDGTARVESIREENEASVFRFSVSHSLGKYVIEKGSVGIDGISLTAVDVNEEGFEVWVVPHTLAHTNLSHRKTGDRVNFEVDMLAKYVEKLLEKR
jgi:riboflavin synthase